MTNIEIVKMLINALDSTGVQDEAIKKAALALLDLEETGEPKAKEKKEPAKPPKGGPEKKAAEKKPARRKSDFDIGKMNALLKAGWSIPKIADEMGVSAPTVRKYMQKEGYR